MIVPRYIVSLSATVYYDEGGRSVPVPSVAGGGYILDVEALAGMKMAEPTAIALLLSKVFESVQRETAQDIMRHRTALAVQRAQPCPRCHHPWATHLNLNGCCAKDSGDQYCYCQELPHG